MSDRAVILVPRRAGVPQRDKIWAAMRSRWEAMHPDLTIYEGHHDEGPFSRSAAINTAARLADADGRWDLAMVIDADVFLDPSQVTAALRRARDSGRVTWAFRRWRGLSEYATERLMRPDPVWERELFGDAGWLGWTPASPVDMDELVEKTNPISWSCAFVIPRAVWDDVGGFDERFRGWGWEDMAFRSVVRGLHGCERIEGDVFHVWHPRSVEREPVRGEYRPEYEANRQLGLRYMAADSDEPPAAWDPALRVPFRHEPAPWTDQGELRKLITEHQNIGRTVSIVIHTDGRRQYAEPSIASLLDQVQARAIIRVVAFDDSGDPAYRAWLEERFGDQGLYVVGPANRLGYTGSMRAMFSYAKRRLTSDYVFLTEDDFLYRQPVDLEPMIDVLAAHPYLSQMALLRAPYYQAELAAGGIVEQDPRAYSLAAWGGWRWLEHRKFWTANPSLVRRSLFLRTWPADKSSERVFGDQLNANPSNRFAFWGAGEPWIDHIGAERAGTGY